MELLKATGLKLTQVPRRSERASLVLGFGEGVARVGSLTRHGSLLATNIVFIGVGGQVRLSIWASYRLSFLGLDGCACRSSCLQMMSSSIRGEVTRMG